MQIFLDTALLEAVKKTQQWLSLDGVTTNPTLISKVLGNQNDIKSYLLKIADEVPTVSVEVIKKEGMISEAKEIRRVSKKFNIKIPFCKEGLNAVEELQRLGIPTNMTLVFSTNQALLAAKAGATYISLFLGRMDDIGIDSLKVLKETILALQGSQSQIIAASIRSPLQVQKCAEMYCDVVTVPPQILEQMLEHPLTTKGIKQFEDDYNKLQK
jgi:transaldolase